MQILLKYPNSLNSRRMSIFTFYWHGINTGKLASKTAQADVNICGINTPSAPLSICTCVTGRISGFNCSVPHLWEWTDTAGGSGCYSWCSGWMLNVTPFTCVTKQDRYWLWFSAITTFQSRSSQKLSQWWWWNWPLTSQYTQQAAASLMAWKKEMKSPDIHGLEPCQWAWFGGKSDERNIHTSSNIYWSIRVAQSQWKHLRRMWGFRD